MAVRIGVISDTHGLMRDSALHALTGVSSIIHAGDVGSPEILRQLETIAPVYAVRGNVDTEKWAEVLPLSRVVEEEGARLFVVHIASEV